MKKRGFTLLMSALVTSLLLAIGFSLFNIAYKEVLLSSVARESHFAFYAADSGAECALYWSFNFPGEGDAFAENYTSPESVGRILCAGQEITTDSQPLPAGADSDNSVIGGNSESYFAMYFPPDPYCAVVHVSKSEIEGVVQTTIESRGYNTCDPENPRRVERAVKVTF